MTYQWQSIARAAVATSFALFVASAGYGAVTVLSPKYPPTTNDPIYVGVPAVNICDYTHEVTRDGFHIHILIATGAGRCILGPPAGPSVEGVALGRLTPGTYSIDAFTQWDDESPEFVGSGAVTVLALVPTLQPPALLFLIVCIAAFGLLALNSRA